MAKQGSISTLPLSEFALAIFVLSLILILLIELPTWMVDISIALNMTLGIVLLMISLFVQKPLELATLPSIILIGTMFRLVLSIASTRLILAKGEAGAAIHAFGTFVTAGNMVVGGVIFLIITVLSIVSLSIPICNNFVAFINALIDTIYLKLLSLIASLKSLIK